MKFRFNDEIFETRLEAEEEARCFAEETFDDVLDEHYPEVSVCGTTFPVSMVLKLNETEYNMRLFDYQDSMCRNIEEVDDEDEEVYE